MAGRLAIDFGTSNSVIAVWDETRGEGVTVQIPELSRFIEQGSEQISVIPSLVHYAPNPGGEQRWLGEQVIARSLYHHNQTFRWMKRYIINRSPLTRQVNGRRISPFEAGRDFLSGILLFAIQELGIQDEEIALTVPVESFEHYENWLEETLEAASLPRFRLIDEPSAAALGYGAHIQPGDVYLIFDFGGGTLDAAVVLIENVDGEKTGQTLASGRRCRVLGKAGVELGGSTIDQWLFEEVLRRNQRSDADDDIRPISGAILVACEQAKERLSIQDSAAVSVVTPETGAALYAEFTRPEFEELLEQKEAFQEIDRTVRRALNAARERGYTEENIKSVLMVGGSSQIPAVQQVLRRIFGRDRVMLNRPLDAIARGAAAFVAGVDFFDHIQHDYGIRFINRDRNEHDYRILVPRGTAYPTHKPVSRLTIKATFDGQAQLGLAIFEMGDRRSRPSGPRMELVFDPGGAARITAVGADEEERRTLFWMNEHQPTFLTADPPAKRGEARFQVEFNIDENKRLLITARDLVTGQLTHRDYPVVKLS